MRKSGDCGVIGRGLGVEALYLGARGLGAWT
jgi:hypothetical protein